GFEIDRCAVQRRRKRAGEKCAVVARIVPREPTLVERILVGSSHEFDRLYRRLAVENDGFAVGLDLLPAERPHQRIDEGRRVAEAVTDRLAERPALRLEFLAGLEIFVPGLRELAVPRFLEPRLAIGDLRAEHTPRQGDPFLAVVRDDPRLLVVAALRLADRIGDVAHVNHALGIELRPIVESANHVRPGARLDCGGGARLDVVAVDHLDVELDAERLGAFRDDLVAQQLVGGRHEIVPAQPMDAGALRIGGRLAQSEHRTDAARSCGDRAGAGQLKQLAPTYAGHVSPPLVWLATFPAFTTRYDPARSLSMANEKSEFGHQRHPWAGPRWLTCMLFAWPIASRRPRRPHSRCRDGIPCRRKHRRDRCSSMPTGARWR